MDYYQEVIKGGSRQVLDEPHIEWEQPFSNQVNIHYGIKKMIGKLYVKKSVTGIRLIAEVQNIEMSELAIKRIKVYFEEEIMNQDDVKYSFDGEGDLMIALTLNGGDQNIKAPLNSLENILIKLAIIIELALVRVELEQLSSDMMSYLESEKS